MNAILGMPMILPTQYKKTMEKRINMSNSNDKFRFVQERLETDKVFALPNIVVANHTLINLRNTPTMHLVNAIRIAALQLNLDIGIAGDIITFEDEHLAKALDFIEYSILKN